MTTEDLKQELERHPFVPLRLHLSSGAKMDIKYPNSAYVQQNTLLALERLAPGSAQIGRYDVISLRLIERSEQVESANGPKRSSNGKKKR
jgi:hypothetical protein